MIIKNIETYIKNPMSLKLSFSYSKYDNVESIHIEEENDFFHIHAIINVLGRKSGCTFDINKEGELLDYECECPWCNEESPCAHIGVTLLKLLELDIDSFPYQYLNDKEKQQEEARKRTEKEKYLRRIQEKSLESRHFIENQKQKYQTQIVSLIQDEQYEIVPFVKEHYGEFILSFKVGSDKKYLIKNITSFLEAIQNNEEIKYGKALTFVHNLNAFDEFSQKQIQFMEKAAQIYKLDSQRKNHYYYEGFALERNISLNGEILDLFFNTYEGNDYDDFTLFEGEENLAFQLEKQDDFYLLSLNLHKDCYLGKDYLYYISHSNEHVVFERIPCDEHGILTGLTMKVSSGALPILHTDYPDFYKYVLSPIMDYIDLSIPPEMNVIENDYSNIRLYGDINEQDEVTIRLEYLDEAGHKQRGFHKEFITNYQQDIVESYIEKNADRIDYDDHLAYFDCNREKTYEFIKEGLTFLKEYCEIYVSEALKKLGETAKYSITVGVKFEGDLLSLNIESTQIPKTELSHVLEQYRRKKKFYRLKNGELLYLNSPQLDELNELINEYHMEPKNIKNGELMLDSYRMFSLDNNITQTKFIQMNRHDSFEETLQKFQHTEIQNISIPEYYQSILRDYQKDGLKWMNILKEYGFNGILADDMGLGKTLQVIVLLESLKTAKPSLVVCPSSLIYNWEDEVHKFSKHLNVTCIVGNQAMRKEVLENTQDTDLFVTSYDYIRRDVELYQDLQFEYIILDEAQYIKNQKTKNAMSVKKINAVHKLALTGTPIENSLAELWSIFDFLMPNYLFNYHYFNKQYENDIVKNQDPEKIEQLRRMVTPFILRRNKKDVLKELPDKIETTQFVQFNEEENNLYLANLAQVNEELQAILNMENVNKVAILAMLTRLRQICCEPRLVYENIDHSSSKLDACIDLISTFNRTKQKVLLFSSFTSVLELIATELSYQNISYYVLTGKTSKEERRELVDKFQNDETAVFLISLKAGGTGLNLTAAQAVIHYDPWWNVSAQNQATDRAYRIGQENKVQVYKLVMKDSIEEKILKLQDKKKELADAFVENNEGSISQMSKEDIMELFALDK